MSAQEREQAALDAALAAGAEALVADDAAAWNAAFPSMTPDARKGWQQVFRGLSRYRWAGVSFETVCTDGSLGTYDIRVRGRLRGSTVWPPICRRDFVVREASGDLTLVDDVTPKRHRHDYYLALSRPVSLARDHLTVVADARERDLAERVASWDAEAHVVARRLHLETPSEELDEQVMVYVCGSARQAMRVAATDRPEDMVCAFAGRRRIYLIAPRLIGHAAFARSTLRHELTHCYAGDFGVGRHEPEFLPEGLAVAIEGEYGYRELRRDMRTQRLSLPLMEALTQEDMSRGRSDREVTLAYEEAGTLVEYVEKEWGHVRLWVFAAAVADSDMTPAGIRQAVRSALGVKWKELTAGWRRYVLQTPQQD